MSKSLAEITKNAERLVKRLRDAGAVITTDRGEAAWCNMEAPVAASGESIRAAALLLVERLRSVSNDIEVALKDD